MHVLEQVEQVRVAVEAFASLPAAEPPVITQVTIAPQPAAAPPQQPPRFSSASAELLPVSDVGTALARVEPRSDAVLLVTLLQCRGLDFPECEEECAPHPSRWLAVPCCPWPALLCVLPALCVHTSADFRVLCLTDDAPV